MGSLLQYQSAVDATQTGSTHDIVQMPRVHSMDREETADAGIWSKTQSAGGSQRVRQHLWCDGQRAVTLLQMRWTIVWVGTLLQA